MDTTVKIATCLSILCFSIIIEVLCTTSNVANNQAPPLNTNSNPWSRQTSQNVSPVNPVWPNSGQTTTPWPELGQRRRNQNQQIQNTPTWVRTASQPVSTQTIPPSSSGSRIAGTSNRASQQPSQANQNDVQDNELREFSESLLQRDVNNAARYITVNYQGKTTSGSKNDVAPQPLLNIQREAYSIPTIAKLMLLHNNYIVETNVNEHVSSQERQEENDLLDALLSTSVMQQTRNFLISKGRIGRDPKEFRDVLKEIWFNMYSRGGGRIGSSGFEHIFLAEIKGNSTVSGLHNWLFFNEEEARNRANYLGYLKVVELGNKGAILKHHFNFHGVDKPVGSMFIGTSPELEIALYSTCFLTRADRVCPLRLAGHNFIIRTYVYRYRGKSLIGSAFPEI